MFSGIEEQAETCNFIRFNWISYLIFNKVVNRMRLERCWVYDCKTHALVQVRLILVQILSGTKLVFIFHSYFPLLSGRRFRVLMESAISISLRVCNWKSVCSKFVLVLGACTRLSLYERFSLTNWTQIFYLKCSNS